jgi:hypothetical protein
VEERPWSFDGDGHLFRLIFTKRLCDVFADELDRFPKGAGFPGGRCTLTLGSQRLPGL